METRNTHSLAEKIARILEKESQITDLSLFLTNVEKINLRLDRIESKLLLLAQSHTASLVSHPSTERFSVVEAFADEIVAILNKEKACTFEPNVRPCDHCSMCSSRGF